MPQRLRALACELEEQIRQRTSELAVVTRERADAIQARTESERQYRDLVESASDIILRTDAIGRFTYVNPRMVNTMGRPAVALIGSHYRGPRR
jgi:PAS domain-containing protein